MKRWYVTFSGSDYDEPTGVAVGEWASQEWKRGRAAGHSPMRRGEDGRPEREEQSILVYDDVWLAQHPFAKLNAWLFEHPGQRMADGSYRKRGVGWYAWKPLVILDALDRADDGDVVLYVDGDTYPIADLSPIYEYTREHGAMLFAAMGHDHRKWCKAACHFVMGQPEMYGCSCQAGVARFCAFRKGDYLARQFLAEWLTYAVNPAATTFDASALGSRMLPEHPAFTEHRTEQAIMTNLAYKYGYPLHREADQSGEGHPQDRDLYPQLFVQVENLTRYALDSNGKGSRWRNV